MVAASLELSIHYHGLGGLHEQRDEVLAVYTEVYADRLDAPFFSLPRYWERLEGYASRDGFSLVTGRLNDHLVGYTLGYVLPAGSAWWRGFRGEADPELLTETGQRTFAITELMVRPAYRRRGYARQLYHALLRERREERAALLVRPDNTPAYQAYLAWGWHKLGEVQPFPDAPVYDALVCELR